MMNEYRHFYLYAKGHYKRTDTISDLKSIVAYYCWFDKNFISIDDVVRVLLKATSYHVDTSYKFSRFMDDLISRISFPFRKRETPIEYIIDQCLAILQGIKVIDIKGELGSPDKNILPLSEEYIKKRLDKA